MANQAQGALGLTIAQRMIDFSTMPTATVKSKKVHFTKNTLSFSQTKAKSQIIQGASRHPSQGVRDKVDVAGNIDTELNANTMLWFAAMGSMESTMSGGTMGSALTTPTAVIDAINQIMTVTSTAHGLALGDSIEILALTAPTSLNGKIFAVIDVPTVDTFKVAIPMSTSTTFTLGSGTIKKVTAAGILTHTLKAGGMLPFYCIEKGFPDISQYFKYLGCALNTLSFGIPNTGIIPVTTTWLGGSETVGSSSFDSGTPLDNGKKLFDGLCLAAADVKEGGSAIATIQNVANFTLNNNLDGDTFVLGGGGSRGGINPGVYDISGSLTQLFKDVTLYTKAKNQTESSLDFTFTRGTGAGTDGNETLQIVTPEMTLTATAPGIEGARGISVNYNFEGHYDNNADITAFKAVIKNAILPGALI